MIIAITGHTSGIGQAIADWFTHRHHHILGFSRSTGHDLIFPSSLAWIVDAAQDADVFVNNAYYHIAQVDLLYAMHDKWRDTGKTILTIGSRPGTHQHIEAVYKRALDKAARQLQGGSCRVLLLRPGPVDSGGRANALSPQYVAEIAGWMIEQPNLIQSLTVVATK
jgi:nucleoside-diphosphate-sugar epimerase